VAAAPGRRYDEPGRFDGRPKEKRNVKLIETRELERLVRDTFAEKHLFSVETELGLNARRSPVVTFVHGGPDPFLDRQFEAWLRGVQRFVAVHQILNGLCRAGVLPPGEYGVSRGA
jgi:hypothetical protein